MPDDIDVAGGRWFLYGAAMRVTGGEMRGRAIRVPRADVRPTQDRVREALFSSLQNLIPDSRFLDLFAGSGAVGLEAWSRGAAEVCWVEESGHVYKVLQKNVDLLCGDEFRSSLKTVRSDVFGFLARPAAAPEFDIIFADPPYVKAWREKDLPTPSELMAAVLKSGLLEPDGIMVLEQGAKEDPPQIEGWEMIRDKRYGAAQLRFFRQKEG